jgi:hypothetical protein
MQGSSSVAINEHLRLKGGARRRVELIEVDSTLVREVIEDVESLDGGRVAAASSKNFLVDLRAADAPAALLADAAAAAAACGAPPPTRVPVLQFGKLRHGRWSVDLRHPMSVLQAFAIFLSAFHWLPLLDTSGEDEG